MDLGEEPATTGLEPGRSGIQMRQLTEDQQRLLHDVNSGCLNILSGLYLLRNADDEPELTFSEMEKSVNNIRSLVLKIEKEWKAK